MSRWNRHPGSMVPTMQGLMSEKGPSTSSRSHRHEPSAGQGTSPAVAMDGHSHPDELNPTPEDWEMLVHPQGWIYFVNRERRWCTEQDIRAPATFNSTVAYCEEASRELPDDVEFFHGFAGRTFVDHRLRMAWLEPEQIHECRSPAVPLAQKYKYNVQYWTYVREHPAHHHIGDSEVVPALQWLRTEGLMRGMGSRGPLAGDEARDCLDFLEKLTDESLEGRSTRTIFIAWVLQRIYGHYQHTAHATQTRQKFYEDFGKDQLSTEAHSSIIRRFFLRLIVYALAGAPLHYLGYLQKIAGGDRPFVSTTSHKWASYIGTLSKEWTDFSLVAAVLLSSTVSFLALGNIGPVAQGACILSSLFASASMLIGVYLVWRHRGHVHYPDAAFFYQWNARSTRLIVVAILLSLPMVFLIWSVVAFLVSIIAYASAGFSSLIHSHDTTSSPNNPNNPESFPVVIAYIIVICAFFIAVAIGAATFVFSRIWSSERYYQDHNVMGGTIPNAHIEFKRPDLSGLREGFSGLRGWHRHAPEEMHVRSSISDPEKVLSSPRS